MQKRLLSIAIAFILTLALSVTAFAAGKTEKIFGEVSVTNVTSWSEDNDEAAVGKWGNVPLSEELWLFVTRVYCDSAPVTITIEKPEAADGDFYTGIGGMAWAWDGNVKTESTNNFVETGDGRYYGSLVLNSPGVYLFKYSTGQFSDGEMFAGESLGFCVIVGGGSTPASVEQPSSWAVEQVNAAIAANLVPKSMQSNYTQVTTRAEFCSLAVALYETVNGAIAGRSPFDDTNDINVQKAASIGIVNGVGNNKFDPNAQLTREQAAVMLSNLANAIGKPLPQAAANFADKNNISSWAADSVGRVQASGIMSGVGNNMFVPRDPYTREQSIITIMRLFAVVK